MFDPGARFSQLCDAIAKLPSAAVAFSGGADSSLLLAAAKEALGSKSMALYAHTPLHTEKDRRHVRAMARELDCKLLEVGVDPLAIPVFTKNPKERCYHCKRAIYGRFLSVMRRYGLARLLDGTNLDDLGDDRPGLIALAELAVLTPLAEQSLTKKAVRAIGHHIGLSAWDRPSGSCLATRVRTGRVITAELIGRIAQAENYLESYGFAGFRVRVDKDRALLELADGDLRRLLHSPGWLAVKRKFRLLGFATLYLDPVGRGR